MRSLALILAAMAVMTPVAVNGFSFRCGLLSFTGNGACKYSCKALGHTTGACEGSECMCSGETGGIADVFDSIKGEFERFGNEVNSWEITQDIKDTINKAQCGISENICKESCWSIGRVSGQCNDDYTDCDCSDEKVSATQFALCRDGGICSTYCQVKEQKASGDCAGPTRWDCFCVDSNGNRAAVGEVDASNL